MTQKVFEEKVKPILTYVGLIGAILAAIVYVIAVVVLIFGFQAKTFLQSIIFAVVNAIVGMIISFFLRIQGISFAKELDENKKVLKEYNDAKPKKKPRPISYFWFTSTMKDLLTKGVTVAAATVGIIYLVIEGSQDYNLLLLAFANLILFACFGLLALVNAYDYYNEEHIPNLKEQIKLKKEKQNNDLQQQQQLSGTLEPSTTSSEEQGGHCETLCD